MQIKMRKEVKRIDANVERMHTNHESDDKKKLKNRGNIFDFLISLSIFLIFFGTPLFFTGMTLQGIGFEKQIFFYGALLIGLVAWIFKGISSGEISIRRTPLDVPILLFLLTAFLSMVFSVNRWDSFLGGFSIPSKGFLAIFSMAAFYWFFMSNMNERRLKLAYRALIGALAILAVFMGLKFSGLVNWVISLIGVAVPENLGFLFERGFNTIGLMGNLGIFFSSGLLLIMANFNSKNGGVDRVSQIDTNVERINTNHESNDKSVGGSNKGQDNRFVIRENLFYISVYSFLTLLLAYLTFALLNYTGMIILLIAFAVYIIFTISKVVPAGKISQVIAVFMFASILLSMIVGNTFQLVHVDLPTEVGLSKRAAWSVSTEAIKENWVVGTGLSTFKYGFSKYRPKGLNNSILWQTKFSGAGLFSELPATGGLLGTLTFVVLVLAYVGLVVVVMLGNNQDTRNKIQTNSNDQNSITKDNDGTADGDNVGVPLVGTRNAGQNMELQAGQPQGCAPTSDTSAFASATARTLLSLFCASILIILYILLNLSSTAVVLFGIMIGTLTVAMVAQARPDMFKEYKFSYHTSPQYALALSFAFMCIASGVIVIFALLGKMFIADVYAKKATNAENFDQAIVLMEQASQLTTFQDEYLSRLGNLYLASGIERMNTNAERINTNHEYDDANDKEEARDLFVNSLNAHRRAAMLAKNDPDRWESYAVAAETMSNYDPTMLDEAIAVYMNAVELNPLNPLLYTRLAKMQVTRGDYIQTPDPASAPSSAEAMADKPAGATAGEVEKAGLYNSAKDNYKKAIALRGDVADFYSNLALTQERMSEIDKAMENFQKALILKPEDPTFLYQLGRLFENSGSVEMGKQYYQRTLDALELIPASEGGVDVNAEIKEALKKLINRDEEERIDTNVEQIITTDIHRGTANHESDESLNLD